MKKGEASFSQQLKSAVLGLSAWLNGYFKIRQRGSTIGTELSGGLATFMNMAYIIPVQTTMMMAIGLNGSGIALAVCLVSGIITIMMGLYANMPIALAPGMGMNALMAYTLVLGKGYPPSFVLFCILIEGILFLIFSLSKVRETVIRAIPYPLKMSISFSIGLFIIYLGLQNSGLAVGNESTLTGMINFRNDASASFTAIMSFLGAMLICALMYRKLKSAMLVGMFSMWGIGIILQLIGVYTPNAEAGYYSLIPAWSPTDFSALGNVLGLCFHPDFQALRDMGMTLMEIVMATISVILTYFYTDTFDTAGTTTGCAYHAGLLDKDGNFKDMKKVMMVDSVGTATGALCSLSPVTAYVESEAGIAAGARTGLAAVTTGFCFLLAMPLTSIMTGVPSFATSAALIAVGVTMAPAGKEIDWRKESLLTLVPTVCCMLSMVVFYSISDGIAVAIITYVVMHVLAGKGKEVNKLLYVLAIIFILKYRFL